MFYFCLLILSLFTIAFVGFKCAIIQLAAYGVGFLILLVVNKNDRHIKRLYNILFFLKKGIDNSRVLLYNKL